MILDEGVTKKLADLSRVSLTNEEIKDFTPQLQGILNYISSLEKVDVSKVLPLTTPFPGLENLRNDEVDQANFETTPEFRVPKVLEK